jgi:putative phosphoesterase
VRLGILSDTHSQIAITRRAVALLAENGAEYYVHCGDVGDEGVLDVLAGLPAAFVFGNNDFDHVGMQRYAEAIGIQCLGTGGVLELAGKRVAVTHGDELLTVAKYRRVGSGVDYLLTGHSHVRHDQRIGSVRWINPGALYRAGVKSVATLDLSSDVLQFLTVPTT